jgi:uncharacterized membrane protein
VTDEQSDDAAGPARAADAVTRGTRALALGALLGLVALGLAWELWLAPTGRGTLALKVLPLLAGVAGVWRFRMRTFRWLSLLVWIYVVEGVTRLITERGLSALLAGAEIVLSLALFAACAAHVRWRLQGAAAA